ncbi:MAG: hypothetical protein JSR78_02165 [Proteobacteria bacterium]|nr:hypothetical protein [Pseudomonadota bacterium]
MSNRVYSSLFYIALIVASSWIAVTVGEALTREAMTKLALLPSRDPRPSRVATYLAEQKQAPEHDASKSLLIPAAPAMTVGALAKAMDESEQSDPLNVSTQDPVTDPSPNTIAPKPRVAGWVRKAPKRSPSLAEHNETSNRLIMRTLRADL